MGIDQEGLRVWGRGLTICVTHLLLPLLHVGKVVDDGLREVLQPPQLHLQRLQLLHLSDLIGQRRDTRQNSPAHASTLPPAGR